METTAEQSLMKKFNLAKLPPAGSEWVGKFFNQLWEDARKEKIGRLGMHQRWIDLHAQYRGKRRRRTYPRVGANYLFKLVETYCATLTEKVPISDVTADDADDPGLVDALRHEVEEWWNDSEQQNLLHASTFNQQLYGTTVEKGVWNPVKDDAEILVRDVFNIFPAPGYRMCDLDSLPYLCDVDFLYDWEIRSLYGIPDDITIPSDADEQLAGTDRETTRGGRMENEPGRHYQSNYATVNDDHNGALKDKTLVVEIWIRDGSVMSEPVMAEVPITDDQGRLATTEMVDTGEVNEFSAYIDGIRKVVICPALMDNMKIRGVLDDAPNPNINWVLLEQRISQLVTQGVPGPVLDPMTRQPVVDAATGQPLMQMYKMPEDKARQFVLDRAKTSFPLWGQFPFSAIASRVDTSQWWGFSSLEQLEELQGKAELMLTKYLLALERQMFPILNLVQGSGVEKSEITNDPGLIIQSTVAAAPFINYIQPPSPPKEYLDALWFVMQQMDIVGMSPDVAEGRRPTGISAASAIIALQDKASTLFAPQVRQIDKLIRNRGRMYIHFKMNFDTTEKQVKIDDGIIPFMGTNIFANFKFNVESGSSAPITKAGRRQQYVELFKVGAMDKLSLLEYLDIPQAKLVYERLVQEQSVPGALQLLIAAGMPPEWAAEIMRVIGGDQNGTKPQGGTTMPTAEDKAQKAGGYSEGMTSANNQMQELQEG